MFTFHRRYRYVGPGMVLLILAAFGCERKQAPAPRPAPRPEPRILDFPAELQSADRTVNAFIRDVIDTCASGDYDAFRMLWSARDDPFPRDQFHLAWDSVQKVTIEAVRAYHHPRDGSILYAVRARVELDPTVREPVREVRILLTLENEQWRLTMPPAGLSAELFDNQPPTTQPGGDTPSPGAS